jgi:hypothetical protein
LLTPHILESVRGERHGPGGRARYRPRAGHSGVDQHSTLGIATDEVAAAQNVEDACPPVGVDRNDLARSDDSIQHAYPLVLEEDGVECRRGRNGIQRLRPGPLLSGWMAHLETVCDRPWACRTSRGFPLNPSTVTLGFNVIGLQHCSQAAQRIHS